MWEHWFDLGDGLDLEEAVLFFFLIFCLNVESKSIVLLHFSQQALYLPRPLRVWGTEQYDF